MAANETTETNATDAKATDAKATPAKSTTTAQKQVTLFSKGDVAEMMGMTTQALANRSGRDTDFPQPTYSNQSGTVQLYTAEDVKKIHEFLTRGERERLEKLNKAIKALG